MSDVKSIFIKRLAVDIESLKKDCEEKVEALQKAIEELKALTEQQVIEEFTSQEDNVRYLAQFTARKVDRDEARAELEKKDGEIEPTKK